MRRCPQCRIQISEDAYAQLPLESFCGNCRGPRLRQFKRDEDTYAVSRSKFPPVPLPKP